jgi:hypothetical protein
MARAIPERRAFSNSYTVSTFPEVLMYALTSIAIVLAAAMPLHTPPQAPAPGKVCIALLLPSVEGVDNAPAVATSVRASFESYLTGPSLQSVMLDAKLASQANEEAKQKECPRILMVTINRKAGSTGPSKAGTIARAAGTTAAYISIPGGAGGAVAAGAAEGSAVAVSDFSYQTHAKDEITMTYKIVTADGATLMPLKSDSAKAKSNGEDLLTPLIAKASEAVAGAISK